MKLDFHKHIAQNKIKSIFDTSIKHLNKTHKKNKTSRRLAKNMQKLVI